MSYLIDEAARALREASTEREFADAIRDAIEAVLEEADEPDDLSCDMGFTEVEVRGLGEAGFLGNEDGVAVRWPNGQEFTVDVRAYRRAS